MMIRRKMLKVLSGLPLGGLIATGFDAKAAGLADKDPKALKSIYTSIGVRPLINARGTITVVGATRVLSEVQVAMDEAVKEFVQLDELMEGVGARLAELTGAEYGIVTSGASAAITVATAACITGGNPDKMMKVPDLSGMKDEVIIPTYSRTAYEAAARAVGVRMVEVSTTKELEDALGPRTAMILVMAGNRSEKGPLSLKEIVALAKPKGVPVLVDAAAEELPVPNPHLSQGADLVVYSGGKCLRGPQCAGLLLGRKDLVRAAWVGSAPHHGFGRGLKVGREEIMGMLAAVEMWKKRDHEGEQRQWSTLVETMRRKISAAPGVTTEIIQPEGLSNRAPTLRVSWDLAKIPMKGHEVEQLLWDGEPRIAVSGAGSFLPFPPNEQPTITISPTQLIAGEDGIVAARVYELLTRPPLPKKPETDAAFNVGGSWDFDIQYAAVTDRHLITFEQSGNLLTGVHLGSFVARDLAGAVNGSDILIRSAYTRQGVRLSYEFKGTVTANGMEGTLVMGEYGKATWKATRRNYQPSGRPRTPGS